MESPTKMDHRKSCWYEVEVNSTVPCFVGLPSLAAINRFLQVKFIRIRRHPVKCVRISMWRWRSINPSSFDVHLRVQECWPIPIFQYNPQRILDCIEPWGWVKIYISYPFYFWVKLEYWKCCFFLTNTHMPNLETLQCHFYIIDNCRNINWFL